MTANNGQAGEPGEPDYGPVPTKATVSRAIVDSHVQVELTFSHRAGKSVFYFEPDNAVVIAKGIIKAATGLVIADSGEVG